MNLLSKLEKMKKIMELQIGLLYLFNLSPFFCSFFLPVDIGFHKTSFLFNLKIFFQHFFNGNLWAINYLSICLSENVFISPPTLKDIFTGQAKNCDQSWVESFVCGVWAAQVPLCCLFCDHMFRVIDKALERAIGSEDSRINSKPQSLKVYFLEDFEKLHGAYRYDLLISGLSSCNLLLPQER